MEGGSGYQAGLGRPAQLQLWQLKSCLCRAAESHWGCREAVLPRGFLLSGDSRPVPMVPCAPAAGCLPGQPCHKGAASATGP